MIKYEKKREKKKAADALCAVSCHKRKKITLYVH